MELYCQLLKVKAALEKAMADETGDTNFISIIVILGIFDDIYALPAMPSGCSVLTANRQTGQPGLGKNHQQFPDGPWQHVGRWRLKTSRLQRREVFLDQILAMRCT